MKIEVEVPVRLLEEAKENNISGASVVEYCKFYFEEILQGDIEHLIDAMDESGYE